MKSSRFLTVCLTACLFFLLSLGGCATEKPASRIMLEGRSSKAAPLTLKMLGFKADTVNLLAIEETMRHFMTEKPHVNITYEGIKVPFYWEIFNKRAAAGVLDDIFMIDHDRVVSLSAAGKLADLSGVLGLDNYMQAARSQFLNSDGSIWFLPTCVSTYGLYVNYDMLKNDGQKVPTNWTEFAAVCDYYAAKGITPIIANNYKSIRLLITARGMYDIYQSGDSEAKIAALNRGDADLAEQLRPGIAMVRTMIERHWLDCAEVLVTTQTRGDLDLFVKGNRPFMITGGWASIRVANRNPGFQYAVHALPLFDDGNVVSLDVDTCVAVNARSKNLAAALDFVAYLITPDVMWKYCDSQSSFTPLNDGRKPSDVTVAPLAATIREGRRVVGSDYRFDFPLASMLDECANALLTGASADEALNLLRQRLAKR